MSLDFPEILWRLKCYIIRFLGQAWLFGIFWFLLGFSKSPRKLQCWISSCSRSDKKGQKKEEDEKEEEEGIDKTKIFVFDDVNTALSNDYFLNPCECFNENWAGGFSYLRGQ